MVGVELGRGTSTVCNLSPPWPRAVTQRHTQAPEGSGKDGKNKTCIFAPWVGTLEAQSRKFPVSPTVWELHSWISPVEFQTVKVVVCLSINSH